MKGDLFLVTVAILVLTFSLASASDPGPLQDFCVAINDSNSAGMYIYTLIVIKFFWNH